MTNGDSHTMQLVVNQTKLNSILAVSSIACMEDPLLSGVQFGVAPVDLLAVMVSKYLSVITVGKLLKSSGPFF